MQSKISEKAEIFERFQLLFPYEATPRPWRTSVQLDPRLADSGPPQGIVLFQKGGEFGGGLRF